MRQRLRHLGSSNRFRTYLSLFSLVALIGFWGHVVYSVFTNHYLQWDLHTYYYGAKVYLDGGNPYDAQALASAASVDEVYPFVYPYYTVWLFSPLLAFDYHTVYYLFFALKLLLLGLLFLLWREHLPRGYVLPSLLFCSLAYRGALRLDILYGNISLVEQVLIWGAVWFVLRGRIGRFCALITASALFKLNTIAVLLLALFERNRRAVLCVATSVAVFLGVLVLTYVAAPGFYTDFLGNLRSLDERGRHNPASLAIIGDAVGLLTGSVGAIPYASIVVYGLYVVGMLGWTFVAVRRVWPLRARIDLLSLGIFLYALLMPRFKDYSYILLIVPTIYVLRYAIRSLPWRIVAVAALCLPLFDYQPFFAALGVYAVFLRWIGSGGGTPDVDVSLHDNERTSDIAASSDASIARTWSLLSPALQGSSFDSVWPRSAGLLRISR